MFVDDCSVRTPDRPPPLQILSIFQICSGQLKQNMMTSAPSSDDLPDSALFGRSDG